MQIISQTLSAFFSFLRIIYFDLLGFLFSCSHGFAHNQAMNFVDSDDGCFWLTMDDLFKYFSKVVVAYSCTPAGTDWHEVRLADAFSLNAVGLSV